MSRIEKLHEISRIDQALAENEARITRQREIISSLNPLSRAAKRAKPSSTFSYSLKPSAAKLGHQVDGGNTP